MNTLYEYGVEFFDIKFRVIVNAKELGTTLLFPTKAAMFANKIADLHSLLWTKHPLSKEDVQLTPIEWIEYMSLAPISYTSLCHLLRDAHDIDIT